MKPFQPTFLLRILKWSNFRKHDDMITIVVLIMVAFRGLNQEQVPII